MVGSWNLEGLIYTFETTREGILDLKLSRRFGAGPRGKSERKWNPTKAYKSNKTWCKFIELLWLSRWGWFWAPVPKVFVMFTKRKHPAKQENGENCSKLAWLSLTYLRISLVGMSQTFWNRPLRHKAFGRKTSLMALGSTTAPLPWAKAKPEGTKWSLEIQQLDRCNWELVHVFVSFCFYVFVWCMVCMRAFLLLLQSWSPCSCWTVLG